MKHAVHTQTSTPEYSSDDNGADQLDRYKELRKIKKGGLNVKLLFKINQVKGGTDLEASQGGDVSY